MEEEMLKKIGERTAEIMGVLGGIHGLFETIEKIHGKLPEGVKKKMAESLGLNAEAAEKTTDDEILFEKALIDTSLSPNEKKVVMDYLGRLRKSNSRLAKEWVRWIHNTLVKFGQSITKSSGQAGNKEIRKSIDYTEGIKITENLFRDIASAPDDETREVFLTQRNICVVEIKPSPTVEAAKKFAKTTLRKSFEAAKTQSGEITSSLRKNATDLKTSSETARAKAKAFYEASKKKGS